MLCYGSIISLQDEVLPVTTLLSQQLNVAKTCVIFTCEVKSSAQKITFSEPAWALHFADLKLFNVIQFGLAHAYLSIYIYIYIYIYTYGIQPGLHNVSQICIAPRQSTLDINFTII